MAAVLFFVPLLAGYLFANSWQLTKYRAAREESQRLYFLAAFYGIFIAVCAFLSCMALLPLAENGVTRAGQLLIDLAPLSLLNAEPPPQAPLKAIDAGLMASFLGMALIWGCVLGLVLNRLTAMAIAIARWIGEQARQGSRLQRAAMRFAQRIDPVLLAIRNRGDDIEYLLVRSVERTMPIQVTLATRKVYVGNVVEMVEPQNDRKTLRLLPLLSGYRSEDDFSLVFTTEYTRIYEQVLAPATATADGTPALRIEDFEIVVQLRDVVSINLFDFNTYLSFSEPAQAPESVPGPDAESQPPGIA